MSQQSSSDFFGLNRPQYVASPEVLLSSLAWLGVPAAATEDTPSAIVYRFRGKASRSGLETSPTSNEGAEKLQQLAEHLGKSLGLGETEAETSARVVAAQLESQTREKARSVGVLPLNLTAALMQNASGVLGVSNPPNFASILDRMFSLGSNGSGDKASGLLVRLFNESGGSDAAMKWMGDCIRVMAPSEIVELADQAVPPEGVTERPAWLDGIHTPFTWFHGAWESLCTGGWFDAMPRRRWVDWATCVLRTAIGAGFLYEMSFYYRLVLILNEAGDAAEAARNVTRPDPGLLRWDPAQSISKQDIATAIQRLANVGTACRSFLLRSESRVDFPKMADHTSSPSGLEEWIHKARECLGDEDLRQDRNDTLATVKLPAGKNMRETINGSLVARTGGLGWVDSYSMLKKRGNRYTLVDPGQDWLSVVASLGAMKSGKQSRVAVLLSDLDSLGLRPSYNTIIEQLESAGLARSSHDADDAVEIAAAF